MTLNEANHILFTLEMMRQPNQYLDYYSKGTIKSAIRTVFNSKSSSKDNIARAASIEANLLTA